LEVLRPKYEVNGFPSIEMSRAVRLVAMTRIRSAVEFCFAVALSDKIEATRTARLQQRQGQFLRQEHDR